MSNEFNIFDNFKEGLSLIDPVHFCEKYLQLNGKPFRLTDSGYKPFIDIYRYIAITQLKRDSGKDKTVKPVVLVKGRQVGATTMAANLSMYFMASGLFGTSGRYPFRLIHAFPTLIHSERYAKTKLATTISSSIKVHNPKSQIKKLSYIESKLDTSNRGNDSLSFKQFMGNNTLQVASTGVDADRLRGDTVDCIFYDECQDIPGLAIANANKLLTKALWGPIGDGIQVYMGTPKLKNSEYYKIWQMSNQQYFHLGCSNCKQLFPLYTPDSDRWMTEIWIRDFTVKCTHCGFEQNKLEAADRGKWVETVPIEKCKYVGFHINQLYTPEFSKDKILEEHPDRHPVNTERTWRNEILGEFYAGSAGLITIEEIREQCADFDRKLAARITLAETKKVYAGFDWGKRNAEDSGLPSGGQSYSVGVVLVDEGTHLNVVYASIFDKNNLEYKKSLVEQIARQYSVVRSVGDIGYANDLTEILQSSFGDKFLASNSLPKVNGYAKFSDDIFPKTILFEKDYYVSEVIDLLKRGKIRFPYKDFEKISWLIEHCASMEIKTTTNQYNEPVRRFVKGKTPNDGFMALINAYLAYKFDLTSGFNSEANIVRGEKTTGILADLCYIKRRVG